MVTNKRVPKRFNLGDCYVIQFWYGKERLCRFIQPTRKGFNFLDLNTHKCILRYHLYPSKYPEHISNNWFWVSEHMRVKVYINN